MPEILTPLQNSFLQEFFLHTQDFYLTGGTALSAFHLHHRYSDDLDLFTQSDEPFQEAQQLVHRVCSQLKVEHTAVRITTYFKHFRLGNAEDQLTLHFSRDFARQIQAPMRSGSILIDSIDDITANKICAALGRTEVKDLVDLYFLDQAGYTIPNYFEAAQQKDAGLSWETLAYALSQFELTKIPPFLIKPVTVESLKQFLEATMTWLIEKSAPPAHT